MDRNALAALEHKFTAHRLTPTGHPPTYAEARKLIEFLHLLESIRRFVYDRTKECIEALGSEIEPSRVAELEALCKGAGHMEAEARWVALTFNWRRWTLDVARSAHKVEAQPSGSLYHELLSPSAVLATGFRAEQLHALAAFELFYRNQDPSKVKRTAVDVTPLWSMTKDWARRILLYANALMGIEDRLNAPAEPTPPPLTPQITFASSPTRTNKRKQPSASPSPRRQRLAPSVEAPAVQHSQQLGVPASPSSPRRSARGRKARSPSPLVDALMAEEPEWSAFPQSQSVLFDREETPPPSAPQLSPQLSPARSARSVRFTDELPLQSEREAMLSDVERDPDADMEAWIDKMPAHGASTAPPTSERASTPHAPANLDVPIRSPVFVSSPAQSHAGASPRITRARAKSPATLAPPADPTPARQLRSSPRRAGQHTSPSAMSTRAGAAFHAKMNLFPTPGVDSSPTGHSTRSLRHSLSPNVSLREYATQLETQLMTQAPHESLRSEDLISFKEVLMSEEDEMAAAASRSRRSSARHAPSTPLRGEVQEKTFEQVVSSATDSWTGETDLKGFLGLHRGEEEL